MFQISVQAWILVPIALFCVAVVLFLLSTLTYNYGDKLKYAAATCLILFIVAFIPVAQAGIPAARVIPQVIKLTDPEGRVIAEKEPQ